MTGAERRQLLAHARLYLCTPIRDQLAAFLDGVLAAGVDVVQLRDKDAPAVDLLAAAAIFRTAADAHGALFIVNDRPDLAVAAGADGVHLGQEDLPPAPARALIGDEMLIGRSTHDADDLARAGGEPVDYVGAGPVDPTPTKPGRPGVGLDHVRNAASAWAGPFFVTGGMTVDTIPAAAAAGARGFVVVRAINDAADPAAAARAIKDLIERVAVPDAGA